MLYLQPASMAAKGLHYLTRVGLLQNRMVPGDPFGMVTPESARL